MNEINKSVVSLLDSRNERIYKSVDSADNYDDNGLMREIILPEYLNSFNPQSLPPYELNLRINCIVILIRNSINKGLYNGTRIRMLDLTDNLLKYKIITGDKAGDIVFINRITLYSDNDYFLTFKRRQFLVRHAFAMTIIKKAQGETFSNVFIDLRKNVFTHGQLYVAIYRVRTCNGLKILIGSTKIYNKVKNYVFKKNITKIRILAYWLHMMIRLIKARYIVTYYLFIVMIFVNPR